MKKFLKGLGITFAALVAFFIVVGIFAPDSEEKDSVESTLTAYVESLSETFFSEDAEATDSIVPVIPETTETKTTVKAATTTTTETATKAPTTTKKAVTTTKQTTTKATTKAANTSSGTFSLKSVPAYSGKAYAIVNNNTPYFTSSEITSKSFERYSSLDSLGRCGVAVASVGVDLMPTEERGAIGQVKPTGWHTVKYDCVDGKYLYNRCHLIGYQLTAENANTRNLITGTRYLNVQGMLPFENQVADYVKETRNHVMYRVTPVFSGNDLLCKGVLMEAYSVEDKGDGVLFCVFCYNVQPGVTIDYPTGESWLNGTTPTTTQKAVTTTKATTTKATTTTKVATTTVASSSGQYILNTNTKKIHYPYCSSVSDMAEHNKRSYSGSLNDLYSQGYVGCKRCNPM